MIRPEVPSFAPTASAGIIAARAAAFARVRAFFAARHLTEVDTPALVNAPVTDVNLHVIEAHLPEGAGARTAFLHTSPEYAMKRLLAAGIGDIYQMSHVFRGGERGRLHNPEFMLIEWYRLGLGLDALMAEVAELVMAVWGAPAGHRPTERLTYSDAFRRAVGFDPLEASRATLEAAAVDAGLERAAASVSSRDELLELVMGTRVGPTLGRGVLTFVHRYPATQAALARLDPADPRVALRFELYADGIELANGFDELADAAEQRARFEADRRERTRRGLAAPPVDERFLAALAAGLPACSGVAVGFDRAFMVGLPAHHIDQVLPFPVEHA